MTFGLTFEKLVLIGVIAALIIGPERLPRYAEGLAALVRRAREFATSARQRVSDEMGEDFSDVDWRTLDPRQYDPRRIIREALLDDTPPTPKPQSAKMAPANTPPTTHTPPESGNAPPYDTEAT